MQKERIQEIKQCYTELVDIFNDIFFVSGETGAYFCNLIEQTKLYIEIFYLEKDKISKRKLLIKAIIEEYEDIEQKIIEIGQLIAWGEIKEELKKEPLKRLKNLAEWFKNNFFKESNLENNFDKLKLYSNITDDMYNLIDVIGLEEERILYNLES